MATAFYLHDAAADIDPDSLINKAADTTRGSSLATAVTNTTATPPATVTKTAGGTAMYWLTGPLYPVTIAGTVTVNLWGLESAIAANAAFSVEVDVYNNNGSFKSVLGSATNPTELGTTAGVQNFTFSPSSKDILHGERLAIIVQIASGGGAMAAGQTVTLDYDGATVGVDGDSYVSFTEEIRGSYPSAKADFNRSGVFPFAPDIGDLAQRAWPGLGAQGAMRGTGPHPYGGFERTLAVRLHQVAAGNIVDLGSPSVNGTSTVSATVVRDRTLTPAISGSSAVTATVVRTRTVAATVNGVATVSATVVRTRVFAPSVNGSTAVTATVVRTRTLIPAVSGSSAVSATVVRTRALTATVNGSSTVTATVIRTLVFATNVAASSMVFAVVSTTGAGGVTTDDSGGPRGFIYYN